VLKNKRLGYDINQSPFYYLRSKKNLARLLFISESQLEILTQTENLYLERDLKSIAGKTRRIEEPKMKLKSVQKRIQDILNRIKLPDYIYAPGQGRSYIKNAHVHLNNRVVKILDITAYFPSTQAMRVYHFFHKVMNCSSDIAGIITKLLTFNNHLPTGSPSSPILSYFSHMEMWNTIYKLVKSVDCNLTVYMDDVTISGNEVSSRLIWEIKKQFHRAGLHSNGKKEKYYINKQCCEITGVIIKNGVGSILPNRQHLKICKIRRTLVSIDDADDNKMKLSMQLQGLESQKRQIMKANKSIAR
jgi:retron-type reverse transcriptase